MGLVGGVRLILTEGTVTIQPADGTWDGSLAKELPSFLLLHCKPGRPVRKNHNPFCQQPASLYTPTEQNIQGQNLVGKGLEQRCTASNFPRRVFLPG